MVFLIFSLYKKRSGSASKKTVNFSRYGEGFLIEPPCNLWYNLENIWIGGERMLLIKSGYVIDPRSGDEGVKDILVDGGTIVRMDEGIEIGRASCRERGSAVV